ncbi:MAG: hypothetical protein WKG01_00455 [Kofleriaceae bacterium]
MHKLWYLLLAVLVACGASSAQVKNARETQYTAPPATLFAEVKPVIEKDYRIVRTDPGALSYQTEPRWYTPEGLADHAEGGNIARLQENSINLSLVVTFPQVDAGQHRVTVTPIILRKPGISSKPETLDRNDPSIPGWVGGKVEGLELAIYEHLKSYAATAPAGPSSTAPTPAPAPTAAPTPIDPGSAATSPGPGEAVPTPRP